MKLTEIETAGNHIRRYEREARSMIPLTFADPGQENIIRKVGGNPEVKRHLENLGFTPGGNVTLISSLGGNVIVKVKEARIALNEEMAKKVMI